jgi:UDP-glucose 4-epimerase
VTGGAGFIGSSIVRKLVSRGDIVRVLDNFTSGKEENLAAVRDKIKLIKADIRDKQACLAATREVDFVLHQAALRSVPKSMHNPLEYNQVNIDGTLNMLEACVENKVKCFVFASSSSVYGEAQDFPLRENFTAAPISPYALTKLAGEYYCRIFNKYYDLNTVSLRYFNVFGPHQAVDDEYAVVIPKFVTCALKREPLPIYGTGRQSRDFTYIDNVVAANLCAVKNLGVTGVFNIASGRDYTILQLVDILGQIMGRELRIRFLPPRPGDVFKTHADISKARAQLNWYPEVDFYEGLRRTLKWNKGQF